MIRLLLLLVGVPMLEMALLIELGRRIGIVATLGIIVVTGVVGAYLARRQGLGVLRQVQAELNAGRMPVEQIADGVMILLAGAVLLTPGILTDALGLLCLTPVTRRWIKTFLWGALKRAAERGSLTVFVDVRGRPPGPTTGAGPIDRDASAQDGDRPERIEERTDDAGSDGPSSDS